MTVHRAPLASTNRHRYLRLARAADRKSLLRFLTCGSVDDGKSTLIGRLLYDSQLILDDQLATLKNESRNRATGAAGIDFSLLVDGLTAEREQGITIDVAYRFFETDKRKFIVADTPGHEQYTRNMATGASNAELAILLVDARKGLLPQTRRHSFILSPDRRAARRAGRQQDRSGRLCRNRVPRHRGRLPHLRRTARVRHASRPFRSRRSKATTSSTRAPTCPGTRARRFCPISNRSRSARTGRPGRCAFRCNGSTGPISISAAFPARWFPAASRSATTFWSPPRASRPRSRASSPWTAISMRPCRSGGHAGARPRDRHFARRPSRQAGRNAGIFRPVPGAARLDARRAGLSRPLLSSEDRHPDRAGDPDQPQAPHQRQHAREAWRPPIARSSTRSARSPFATDKPIAFDTYGTNPRTGGFILIDRLNNATLGAGVIDFGLRRAQNLTYQAFDVNRDVRARQKGQIGADRLVHRPFRFGQVDRRQPARKAPDRRRQALLHP